MFQTISACVSLDERTLRKVVTVKHTLKSGKTSDTEAKTRLSSDAGGLGLSLGDVPSSVILLVSRKNKRKL